MESEELKEFGFQQELVVVQQVYWAKEAPVPPIIHFDSTTVIMATAATTAAAIAQKQKARSSPFTKVNATDGNNLFNSLRRNITRGQWPDIIQSLPALIQLMKSPFEDTEMLNEAIKVLLDILELNKQDGQAGGMDRDAATTFKEIIVDVFQDHVDHHEQEKRKLGPMLLPALAALLQETSPFHVASLGLRTKLFQCVNSLLGQCPENKRFLRSRLKTIKDLGEHLFQEQEILLQLDILGILFRISPTKRAEREAFAKENFSNELATIFLEMRAENFAMLSRKFLLAAQEAKPKALFGWTLVSDSVQSSIVMVPKAKEYLVDFNLSSIHIFPQLDTTET
ncbi:hypothetical protein BGZ50_006519 [Haplosporangium sp. Z 11]|nr:hypothetical protein BGZ50_006519 [Haplosporangium sp. Z 11]